MKTIGAILAEAHVRRSESFGPETPGWVDLHSLHSGNLRVHDRLTQKEISGVGSTSLRPGLVGISSVFFRQSAIRKDDTSAGAINKHTGPRQTRKTGDFWAMTQSSTIVKPGVSSVPSFTSLNHASWPGLCATRTTPSPKLPWRARPSSWSLSTRMGMWGSWQSTTKRQRWPLRSPRLFEAPGGKLTPCAPPQKRRTPKAPSAGTSGSAKRLKHSVLTTGGPMAFLDHSPHVKLVRACVDCRPEARRLLTASRPQL